MWRSHAQITSLLQLLRATERYRLLHKFYRSFTTSISHLFAIVISRVCFASVSAASSQHKVLQLPADLRIHCLYRRHGPTRFFQVSAFTRINWHSMMRFMSSPTHVHLHLQRCRTSTVLGSGRQKLHKLVCTTVDASLCATAVVALGHKRSPTAPSQCSRTQSASADRPQTLLWRQVRFHPSITTSFQQQQLQTSK